MKIFRL